MRSWWHAACEDCGLRGRVVVSYDERWRKLLQLVSGRCRRCGGRVRLEVERGEPSEARGERCATKEGRAERSPEGGLSGAFAAARKD